MTLLSGKRQLCCNCRRLVRSDAYTVQYAALLYLTVIVYLTRHYSLERHAQRELYFIVVCIGHRGESEACAEAAEPRMHVLSYCCGTVTILAIVNTLLQ